MRRAVRRWIEDRVKPSIKAAWGGDRCISASARLREYFDITSSYAIPLPRPAQSAASALNVHGLPDQIISRIELAGCCCVLDPRLDAGGPNDKFRAIIRSTALASR